MPIASFNALKKYQKGYNKPKATKTLSKRPKDMVIAIANSPRFSANASQPQMAWRME